MSLGSRMWGSFFLLELVTWFELVILIGTNPGKKYLLYANDSICDPVKHSLVQHSLCQTATLSLLHDN